MQVDSHEHTDSHEMVHLVTHPHQGNLWKSLICYLQRIHQSSITRGVSATGGEQWQRALHLLKECIEGKDRLSVATQQHLVKGGYRYLNIVDLYWWLQLSGCQVSLVVGGYFSHLFSLQFCLLWAELMRFLSTLLSVPVRSAANGHGHCTSCSRWRMQASISFSKSNPHHISCILVKHRQIWPMFYHISSWLDRMFLLQMVLISIISVDI